MNEEMKSTELSIEEILTSIRGVINGSNISHHIGTNLTSSTNNNTEEDSVFELTNPIEQKIILSQSSDNSSNSGFECKVESNLLMDNITNPNNLDQNMTYSQHSYNRINNIKQEFEEYIIKNNNNDDCHQSDDLNDRIISEPIASNVAAQFKQFNDVLNQAQQCESKILSDKTLDALVIELIKPKLSKWLDENLESLVSNIIEREIKKLLPNQ